MKSQLLRTRTRLAERFRFEIAVSPLISDALLILQTWPFVVSGRPDSDTKEVSAASRLCGTTA